MFILGNMWLTPGSGTSGRETTFAAELQAGLLLAINVAFQNVSVQSCVHVILKSGGSSGATIHNSNGGLDSFESSRPVSSDTSG